MKRGICRWKGNQLQGRGEIEESFEIEETRSRYVSISGPEML